MMPDVPLFGVVPDGWRVDRLKDCMSSIVGGDWGDDPGADTDGEDLVVLRVADFAGIGIGESSLTTRRIKESKIPHRLVTDRTLLLEKSGGGEKSPVGRVVWPGPLEYRAICSNFIAKMDVRRDICPRFLNYVFSSLYDTGANTPHIRQTTGIQNLSIKHYLSTKIAIPAISEQWRIVEYLDGICASVVPLSASNRVLELPDTPLEEQGMLFQVQRVLTEQLSALDGYRKAVIHEYVSGKCRVPNAQAAKAVGNV